MCCCAVLELFKILTYKWDLDQKSVVRLHASTCTHDHGKHQHYKLREC